MCDLDVVVVSWRFGGGSDFIRRVYPCLASGRIELERSYSAICEILTFTHFATNVKCLNRDLLFATKLE